MILKSYDINLYTILQYYYNIITILLISISCDESAPDSLQRPSDMNSRRLDDRRPMRRSLVQHRCRTCGFYHRSVAVALPVMFFFEKNCMEFSLQETKTQRLGTCKTPASNTLSPSMMPKEWEPVGTSWKDTPCLPKEWDSPCWYCAPRRSSKASEKAYYLNMF